MGEVHVEAISPFFVRCNDQLVVNDRPGVSWPLQVRTETASLPDPASDNPVTTPARRRYIPVKFPPGCRGSLI
jgi:hypothetical protein